MLLRKRFSIYLLVLSLLAGVAGCSNDENNPPAPAAKANVMVIHASPDAPGIDIVVEGNVVMGNLTYPNNTAYYEVNAGTRNVKVNTAGTSNTIIEANFPVDAGKNYSVFVADTLGFIEPLVFIYDLTAPDSGKAKLRFIHLSPDAPGVDLTFTDQTVLFGNSTFKESSDFISLNAGTYDLFIRLEGVDTILLPILNTNLENGKIYTLFLRGLVGGLGAQSLDSKLIVNK